MLITRRFEATRPRDYVVPAMECVISPQMAALAKNCIFPWAEGLLALVKAKNFGTEIPAEVRTQQRSAPSRWSRRLRAALHDLIDTQW